MTLPRSELRSLPPGGRRALGDGGGATRAKRASLGEVV